MSKIFFMDTNALLHSLDSCIKLVDECGDGKIYISSVTLRELEEIKTSGRKDELVKYNARRATRFMSENDSKFKVSICTAKHHKIVSRAKLEPVNDNLIIATAVDLSTKNDVVFVTNDMCCMNVARWTFGLEVRKIEELNAEEDYSGFKVIEMDEKELYQFYNGNPPNMFGLLKNQYLVVTTNGEPMMSFKWTGEKFNHVNTSGISGSTLDKLVPKDEYQRCAIDSMFNNKLTVLKGKPGSGKSLLAMSFLFRQLDKGIIDRIIIFCNPTKVRGSQELGFYKGTKDDKLMDGQIGSFLASKLGSSIAVEDLIMREKLILLPMSDVRGYDTTGLRAGIFITEAQNTSVDLMKLALQRIGDDGVCVIDGDYNAQVDSLAYAGANNGLRRLSEVFRGEDIYGEVELVNIYRSKIAEIADKM